MQKPGTNPNIPETATITFKLDWSRRFPGEKVAMTYIETKGGRGGMICFPHKDWAPPIGVPIECVLWPGSNVVFASPVGGIPENERTTESSNGSHAELSEEDKVIAVTEQINDALTDFVERTDKLLQELNPALAPTEEGS